MNAHHEMLSDPARAHERGPALALADIPVLVGGVIGGNMISDALSLPFASGVAVMFASLAAAYLIAKHSH